MFVGQRAGLRKFGLRFCCFALSLVESRQPPVPFHLVGIHPDFRRRGVGRLLYQRFTEGCRAADCIQLKAITAPGNEGSIRFHVALDWKKEEVDDYAGPGRKRIVFTKSLV